MKIFVVYRQTENWLENIDSFKHGLSNTQIDEWEKFFNMSFSCFRNSLKNIASELLVNYNIINYEDIEKTKISDEDILIPSDDDDWLYPNLLDYFKDVKEDVIYWESSVIQSAYHFGFHRWHEWHEECGTNSSAIKYKIFKNLSSIDKENYMLSHNSSYRILITNNLSYKFIQDTLSMYLWHLGSASVIKTGIPDLYFPSNEIPLLSDQFGWCNNSYKKYVYLCKKLISRKGNSFKFL